MPMIDIFFPSYIHVDSTQLHVFFSYAWIVHLPSIWVFFNQNTQGCKEVDSIDLDDVDMLILKGLFMKEIIYQSIAQGSNNIIIWCFYDLYLHVNEDMKNMESYLLH